MIPITSLEDFKTYKGTQGYFIIADDVNGRKMHSNRCTAVDITHFRTKVLEKEGQHGRYFFTEDFFEAREYPKVKKCELCRKFM
ncbi:hypothetical protein [Paenibacillus montanisoli]|uniref:Uncharacterized protein n=1 Tax=Paenibacillus montanisoli TaxID=2081970 RepID=A0A328U777_9BACL|nr:hypothetical protein [Paenibacillus montanisoli]RAP75866.1 hypothetical protein DL346_10550 [Paenibacillus montanisoli]